MNKVYNYKSCSTCVKAKKFLDKKGIQYKDIPIVETPPSKAELRKMLSAYDGELKKLFNTSGLVYREMKLKDKINTISKEEAIELLSKNGKLIKRPFLIGPLCLVGFKEEEWGKLS